MLRFYRLGAGKCVHDVLAVSCALILRACAACPCVSLHNVSTTGIICDARFFGGVRSVLFGYAVVLFMLRAAATLAFLLFWCSFPRCFPLSAVRMPHLTPSESLLVGNRPLNSGKSTILGGLADCRLLAVEGYLSRHLSDLVFC